MSTMNYVIDGRIDIGGHETDRRAKEYAQEHGISYRDALSFVIGEQHRYSAENGLAGSRGGINAPAGVVEAYWNLANVAANAGSDSYEVARQINRTVDRDTIRLAAQLAIERRKNEIVSDMAPSRANANLASAYRQVADELPATWQIYELGGNMTPDAAREMFTMKKYSRGNEVRRYTYSPQNRGSFEQRYWRSVLDTKAM